MRSDRARSGTQLIVAGLVLVLTGLTLLLAPDDPVAADAGSVLHLPVADRRDAAIVAPQTSVPAPQTRVPAPQTRVPAPQTPVPTPQTSTAPAPGFTPERLLVKTLDVDAPLVTTLVDTDGAFVPPEDPAQLGWWRGVRPREGEGSVVVAGHIDSRRFGQGPLARIVELRPGDRAALIGPGGASAEYVVRGIQTFPKESFPASELFGTDGSERLVLVTCGGTYDRERGGWDSNVVAVLDPAPPA